MSNGSRKLRRARRSPSPAEARATIAARRRAVHLKQNGGPWPRVMDVRPFPMFLGIDLGSQHDETVVATVQDGKIVDVSRR